MYSLLLFVEQHIYFILIILALVGGYTIYWLAFARVKLRSMPAPEIYSPSDNVQFDPYKEKPFTKHDFPMGWYPIMEAKELKPGATHYAHYLGEHFAIFRAKDGSIYAVDAYCPHLGSNLGISGKVRDKAIECGFHGWTFDGKTGLCTNHTKARNGCFKAVNGQCKYVVEDTAHEVRIKTWEVREVNRMIYLWFHPLGEKPLWEPYNIPEIANGKLHFRGGTVTYVRTNIRDIRENGADTRHVNFVHKYAMKYRIKYKLAWRVHSFFFKGFEDILSNLRGLNKQYIHLSKTALRNANSDFSYLSCATALYDSVKKKTPLFHNVLIHVGPGQQCIETSLHFLPKITFTTIYDVVPVNGKMQKVFRQFYTPWYVPYWLSSVIFKGEIDQDEFDLKIWNNKKSTECHLIGEEADTFLMAWRQWFTRFYAPE